MSYRYNTIDIAVGVGMCAILFGALLLFVAVNGTYQAIPPQALATEQSVGMEHGVGALQPAIGHAIVDLALMERQANQAIMQSVAQWNHIVMTHHDWQSGSSSWLSAVLRQGITAPADHLARVQGVMGRAIVNVTTRGVRNGLLSADQYGSMYNMRMIATIEAQGQRLHNQFASTWQATLGRWIVEAAQHDWLRTGAIQERLGSAVVQVAHAQMSLENGLAVRQEPLASLILAAARQEALANPTTLPTIAEPLVVTSHQITIASNEAAPWPEIPMGYLIIASILLAAIFLTGLSMVAQSREARALAQMKHDAERWAFRMAT